MRSKTMFTLAAYALSASGAIYDARGADIGRWRMPSTLAQAAGFGYGPGHHAPIVRAPGYRTPPAARIVVAPRGQQPFCPQAYREIGGCCPGGRAPFGAYDAMPRHAAPSYGEFGPAFPAAPPPSNAPAGPGASPSEPLPAPGGW